MGMYTELIFGAELKKDTPQSVINTLLYMTGYIEKPYKIAFDFIRNPLDGTSGSFGVNKSLKKMWFEKEYNTWHISTRSNIRNYSNDIDNFLDWIKPYVERGSGIGEFYAIKIYEDDKYPIIYYKDKSTEKNKNIVKNINDCDFYCGCGNLADCGNICYYETKKSAKRDCIDYRHNELKY